jgi:hypothetical protein
MFFWRQRYSHCGESPISWGIARSEMLFGKIPDGDLVVAFRNVLAHGYATLDHRRVYEIASSRAGELLKTLETLLTQIPEA